MHGSRRGSHVDGKPKPLEKNAGLIMATNNATTALKASTERYYLQKPHFYKYFAKPDAKRATPAIHRGYWLRMRAVEWTVKHFLERETAGHKLIINLGSGFDPLPFRLMSQYGDLCAQNVKFIDVDYEPLLESKRDIIVNTPEMRQLLHGIEVDSYDSVLLNSQQYAAVGCDLRNLPRLELLLKEVCDLEEASILCIAEESMAFMAVEASDALLSWCVGLPAGR
jgi:tRNA wybutosine-synthesizing protein 4